MLLRLGYDRNRQMLYQARFDNLMKGNNLLKITPPNNLTTGIYLIKVILFETREKQDLSLVDIRY